MGDSFEVFADRELPSLLRYATVLTGDAELATDLVQDVMLKAHSRWAHVAELGHPRAYVRTMITNEFLSWRRRWAVRNIVPWDTSKLLDEMPVDDVSDLIVERLAMRELLAQLPRQQRAALVLRYYEGLKDEEIADAIGCSAGTVRGYISRALRTLRSKSDLPTLQFQEP